MNTSSLIHDVGHNGVYTGFWINWTLGRVFGATITLTNRNGALLIAFLALFTGLAGTGLWRISCFILHHIYSTEAAQDALHHQRQLVLRNSANGTTGLWSLTRIIWAWNFGKANNSYKRLMPLFLFTLLLLGASGTASTFSSKIATAMGHEVLISSRICGPLGVSDEDYLELNQYFFPAQSALMTSASNYASQCYAGKTEDDNCLQYVKLRFSTTTNRNASCPFDERICKLKQDNIVLDTGFIDSHYHLGLNTPAEDRVLFRRVTSCAPLETEGFKRSAPRNDSGFNFTYYSYGSTYREPNPNMVDPMRHGATYLYPEDPIKGFDVDPRSEDYTISTEYHLIANGTTVPGSTFEPIRELATPDADTYIIFLSSNKVDFASIVSDPWYSAHQEMGSMVVGAGGMERSKDEIPIIRADEPASPLACKIQCQICNPNLSETTRCTPLSSFMDVLGQADGLWDIQKKGKVLAWVENPFIDTPDAPQVASGLRNQALLSRSSLSSGIQGPLPSNQWQLEVEHWHNISMAYFQNKPVSIAKGPSDPEVLRYLTPPNGREQQNLCKNQKVYSRAHFNFSVFWLSFTLSVGTIIIILSYTLEMLVFYLQHRFHRDTYARLEWAANEALQLQRLANEELGIGPWKGCCDGVPVPIDASERLATLDASDPDHPRLKAPMKSFDQLLAAGETLVGDKGVIRGVCGRREDSSKAEKPAKVSETAVSMSSRSSEGTAGNTNE